jgi:hypothetical protein
VNDPDLSLPTIVSGIELTDIGREIYKKKWQAEKIADEKLLTSRSLTATTEQSVLTETEFLIKSLTMLDVSLYECRYFYIHFESMYLC